MTLQTRQPTGLVAYPLILVEGGEKVGKSYTSYSLSTSPKVGRTFVFDLGEGTADEYKRLGPYEIVPHNGTFSSLFSQLEAACAEPMVENRPNVIVLDDGTALWDLLKDWVNARARASRAGQTKLKEDPDAEIDPATNLWNDAKDRWRKVINLLRYWPGIAVIICKGAEVTKFQNGKPVAGQVEWKVDAEKTTVSSVGAWVRMSRPHTATLIGVRSLDVELPRAGLILPDANPLEHLVFDVLGAGGGFASNDRTVMTLGMERPKAKQRLLDLVLESGADPDDAKTFAGQLWKTTGDPAELTAAEWDILAEVTRVRLPILMESGVTL